MGNADCIDVSPDTLVGLLNEGQFEQGSTTYKVIEEVVRSGYHALSENQRAVYETVIIPELLRPDCELKARQSYDPS